MMEYKQPILRYKAEIESEYAKMLAPYATHVPCDNSRKIFEKPRENENRGDFQRDRDRIIHSNAFRRMMYKTQVFVNHEGDHFRTRLTHSLEVSQFARGIAKSLALNEDLAEAIALGHDLGHTPFGHAAEAVFAEKLKEAGLDGFYHNEQSVRVVEILEDRDLEKYSGLNLTQEVREGILKHNQDRTATFSKQHSELSPDLPCRSIEGQIVNLVDTIAYTCHDLHDGIISGILKSNCEKNPDIQQAYEDIEALIYQTTEIRISNQKRGNHKYISDLIHYFVTKLTVNTHANLIKYQVQTLEDVAELAAKKILIAELDEPTAAFLKSLKQFVRNNIYRTSTIQLMDQKAKTVVKAIYDAYFNNPALLPAEWRYKLDHSSDMSGYEQLTADQCKARILCDYIACMTDRYALEEHEKLFNPRVKI